MVAPILEKTLKAAEKTAETRRKIVDPVAEAQDSLLNKTSKLRLAEQALMLQHMQEVAHDDVDSVRRLKAKHLGPEFKMDSCSEKKGDTDVGNIIITDDYHHNDAQPVLPVIPPATIVTPQAALPMKSWPIGAGIALAGTLIAGSMVLPKLLEKPPASKTTIEKSGFLIDLPDGVKK